MHWQSAVRRIQNGMKVDEAVANMPVDDLVARTDYLKRMLEAFQAGHALTHQDAPLHADTFVGAAVYWSTADEAYKNSLAEFEVGDGGVVTAADSALCLGIVIEKSGTDVGTVCLFGYLDGVDITAATGATPTAGVYYVSPTQAGKLVRQKPPFAVRVAYVASGTKLWVEPDHGNPHEHQHYVFELNAVPAGETNSPSTGDPYVFSDEWDDYPGWLPADNAAFTGMQIPDGAAFGYNLAAHGDVQAAWPPLPVASARFYLDGVLQRPEQVVINEDGIWWMTNCPDAVPWQGDFDSTPGCPPNWGDRYCVLAFEQLLGLTADAFVTQLKAEAPLSVVSCATGLAATRGSLEVRISPLEVNNLAGGGEMPNAAIYALDREAASVGPNVSGVRTTGKLSATGTGGTYTDEEGRVFHLGGVTISSTDADEAREGFVEVAALDDVGETEYQGNIFLVMRSGRDGSVRGRFTLPAINDAFPASATCKLVFWLLGTTAGSLPELSLTYRRLALGTSTPVAIPTSDTSLANLTPSASAGTYRYQKVESEAFSVSAGDLIYFTIARGSSDSYTGDVGILAMRWQVDAAA